MPAGFRLAPDVTLTRLPFGGVVLVHGVTLAVAEFSERDAVHLDEILATDMPPASAELRQAVDSLLADGWLARHAATTGSTAASTAASAEDSQ